MVDDIDRRMVDVLQDDGRAAVATIATRVGISRAAAYQRLQRLRDRGVITGFGVRTDPAKLGVPIAALISIDVEQRGWRDVRSSLADLPGLEWLGMTTGDHDFVLLVRVADVNALRDVVVRLQGIEGIRSTQTTFVLDEDDRR